MTASIIQRGTTDTQPLNTGYIGNDGTTDYFPIVFPTATIAGSTIVIFGMIFPNFGGNGLGTCSDPVNGSYGTPLDSMPNAGGGNSYINSYAFQNAASIGAGDIGKASGGSVTTLVDSTKAWTVNEWAGQIVIDLTNNVSHTVISNTSTTLTFASGTAVSASDYYVVGTFIKIQVTGPATDPFYNFGECIEVGNAATSGAIVHSSQSTTTGGAGTDNISSGTATCSSSGLMIGYAGNISGGGATPFIPTHGTGFTNVASLFVADNGTASFCLESQYFSSTPGSKAATWSSNGADTFPAFMIFISDATSGGNSAFIAWLV